MIFYSAGGKWVAKLKNPNNYIQINKLYSIYNYMIFYFSQSTKTAATPYFPCICASLALRDASSDCNCSCQAEYLSCSLVS
nr:MAG TPA: hypothetical protein [Caudoviricetes sp.]